MTGVQTCALPIFESLPKWFTSKFTSAEQYIVLPNYLILTNDYSGVLSFGIPQGFKFDQYDYNKPDNKFTLVLKSTNRESIIQTLSVTAEGQIYSLYYATN